MKLVKNTNNAKPATYTALSKAIQLAIDSNEILKAAILLHPKQWPRAGVTGSKMLILIEAINELKVQYDRLET